MLKNLQLDVLLVCPVAASITVGKNELRVHNDGLSKVLYSQLETVETGMGQAPVVVGEGELRVDTDSLVQVFNRPIDTVPGTGPEDPWREREEVPRQTVSILRRSYGTLA